MSELPTKKQVLDWIRENPAHASKREVARAFGVKGADRIPLKRMLRELEAEGEISRDRKQLRETGAPPPVLVLRVGEANDDGDLTLDPATWDADVPAPQIAYVPRKADPALKPGDRILGRLSPDPTQAGAFNAHLIRRIGSGPAAVIGIFRKAEHGGRIQPVDKKSDREWQVAAGETGGARDGELVRAEAAGPRGRMGLPRARVTERLGDPSGPRAVSLIAIEEHGIPNRFPDAVLAEADRAKPATAKGRVDLRHLPLITIDPADARDHDDACCAIPDGDGHVLWVAIADVAHYVTSGSALDREARNRGNSTYFPDRVVPMLPDALSGDLCSLHQGVDRPCIAVEIRIDADGNKIGHQFHRGLMRSPASLTYAQAQAAANGSPDDATAPHQAVIADLFAAYRALERARDRRQPLHLDLPEREIRLSDTGDVLSVSFRDRMDAHRLIEEFMVLANVCAAETLLAKSSPLLFRVHETPAPEKLDALRDTAKATGHTLAKGQVLTTKQLNRLLDAAAGHDDAELINMSVLRSMTQAYYAPENLGHFGLNLRAYAHFTSPIRRYADLIVHRALISAHGWGKDGLHEAEVERLPDTADWISQTERRSMLAERDTTDRYLAAYLAERVDQEFTGRVSGIARFGLFVKLDDTGADGLVPIRSLGDEYWSHDREAQTLMGDRSGRTIRMGQRARIRLIQAEAITGGLLFELLEIDSKEMPRNRAGNRNRPSGRRKSRTRSRRPGKPQRNERKRT